MNLFRKRGSLPQLKIFGYAVDERTSNNERLCEVLKTINMAFRSCSSVNRNEDKLIKEEGKLDLIGGVGRKRNVPNPTTNGIACYL